MQVIAGGTSTSTTQTSLSSSQIKPRRKYGIRFLHKNIEAMKYEHHHQAVLIPNSGGVGQIDTLPTVPLDYSQHSQNISTIQQTGQQFTTTQNITEGQISSGGEGGSQVSHQNITILSIPSHAMNTVHILDNSGHTNVSGTRISKPLAEVTDNVIYQHQPDNHHQQQAITLVSYQPSSVAASSIATIEPIQPTSVLTSPVSVSMSSGPLTELTSSPAIPTSITSTTAANSSTTTTTMLPHAAGSARTIVVGDNNQPHQTVESQQQPQPASNDNFMRLLEAIALTEDT